MLACGAVHAALAALGSSVVIEAAHVCGTVLVCCKALSCCAFMGSSAHARCAALAFGTVLALCSLSRKWRCIGKAGNVLVQLALAWFADNGSIEPTSLSCKWRCIGNVACSCGTLEGIGRREADMQMHRDNKPVARQWRGVVHRSNTVHVGTNSLELQHPTNSRANSIAS